MPTFLHIVSKAPLPTGTRLAWQRSLLDRAFVRDIATARKANDREKVRSLESDHRYEIDMHDEKEDALVTRRLLATAQRFRVPVPHRHNEDKSESDHWYQGHYTGGWYLTNRGISLLREEIRKESKARHEARSRWVVWLSALTGLVGAVTGLVALLTRKPP